MYCLDFNGWVSGSEQVWSVELGGYGIEDHGKHLLSRGVVAAHSFSIFVKN